MGMVPSLFSVWCKGFASCRYDFPGRKQTNMSETSFIIAQFRQRMQTFLLPIKKAEDKTEPLKPNSSVF
jgi:hypothetical protein